MQGSSPLVYLLWSTELELTEQKTMGHISSSSQSSIAALKDVLAYGILTSSPPLPPPFTLWRTTDRPYTISLYLLGRSVGEARGCGGGGREQSSSISCILGNSGALSTLKQIVHISSYLERLFHSVNSNSVSKTY